MAFGDTTENTMRSPLASAGTVRSVGLDRPPTRKRPKRPGLLDKERLAGERASGLAEKAAARQANQTHMGVRQPIPQTNRRQKNGNGY